MSEQLFVRPLFTNAALLQNHDLVGAADRRQPVRDHNHRAMLHQVRQRLLHQHFRLGIEVRRRLIQNQDGRVLEQARAMAMRCRCPPLA